MPDDIDFDLLNRYERLKHIADRLKKKEEVPPVTVRTLLSWFNASRRGLWVVASIDAALSTYGLETSPYYGDLYLDGAVHFVLRQQKTETLAVSDTVGSPQAPAKSMDSAIRISRLPAANVEKLVVVNPDTPLSEAVTKMLYYDYSQLPVMTSEREVKGIVSWTSIGTRLAIGAGAVTVRDVMDPHREIASSESMFDALPIIAQHQYVLVRGPDRRITGIVTGSDLSVQFRQLAEPFLLLGEIENVLRQQIESAGFTSDHLASARDPADSNRPVTAAKDLSFGEYVRFLQDGSNWEKIGLPVDQGEFCRLLEQVRGIRNGIMHFDPDGVDPDDLETLRRLMSMFQRLASIEPAVPA